MTRASLVPCKSCFKLPEIAVIYKKDYCKCPTKTCPHSKPWIEADEWEEFMRVDIIVHKPIDGGYLIVNDPWCPNVSISKERLKAVRKIFDETLKKRLGQEIIIQLPVIKGPFTTDEDEDETD